MKDNFVKKPAKLPSYNNIVDAARMFTVLKKLGGMAVIDINCNRDLQVTTHFSLPGFVAFVFWELLFAFCTYKAFSENQTILRNLHATKLRHYGDILEKIVSTAYVQYGVMKITFQYLLSIESVTCLLEIDSKIKNLGVIIDYTKLSRQLFWGGVVQIIAGSTRFFSVWILLINLNMDVPVEGLLQVSLADVVAVLVCSHYCYLLMMMKDRLRMINDLMAEVRDSKSWENIVLVRSKQATKWDKVVQYQDKYICEKMKACARIFGLWYKATETVQVTYGLALTCTLTFCLFYIILYLFNFMEATASGLFHDTERYVSFLVFVFWQITYTVGVIYMTVYFSERVVEESKKTSFILHEIINADISPPITAEALNFSIQMLHQVPKFTACGLCNIDYPLLLQGTRTIATYLVILLQFVMDDGPKKSTQV